MKRKAPSFSNVDHTESRFIAQWGKVIEANLFCPWDYFEGVFME